MSAESNEAYPNIPGYVILDIAGQGGAGIVYRAREKSTQRDVAIKMLLDSGDEHRQAQFTREAHVASQLEHPHILPVFDFGVYRGRSYLVTRFAESGTVEDLIRQQGSIPVEKAIRWCADIADALDLAHIKGLIHRDVKPSNMLLDQQGFVYLSDFGLATSDESEATAAGSAPYMAPERVRGEPANKTSDIYALACSLFEMVTGRTPFDADDNLAMRIRHLEEPIPMASVVNPAVTIALEDAISWGMAKQIQQRPPTAKTYADALRVAEMHPNSNVRISSNFNLDRDVSEDDSADEAQTIIGDRVDQEVQRRPARVGWLWALLAFMLIAILGAGGFLLNQLGIAPFGAADEDTPGGSVTTITEGEPEPTPTPLNLILFDDYGDPATADDLLDDARLLNGRLEFTSESPSFWSFQPANAADEVKYDVRHEWYITEPAESFEQGWGCHFASGEDGVRFDGIVVILESDNPRVEGWRFFFGDSTPTIIGSSELSAGQVDSLTAGSTHQIGFACADNGMTLSIDDQVVGAFELTSVQPGDFAYLSRVLINDRIHRVEFDNLEIVRTD